MDYSNTVMQVFTLINCYLRLLYGRLVFAAIAASLVIGLIMAVRHKLSPRIRSWCWGACFIGLVLPMERGFIFLLGDSLDWFNNEVYYSNLAALPAVARYIIAIALMLLFLFWLVGSVVLVFKTRAEFEKARRAIVERKLPLCASYFHRFRSHIYKPPDFETGFTHEEQAMMLAHEKQHIAQHDPLLFRLLALTECVFWFCPPVHKAAALFRQDRELLCDERVVAGYSKRDYSTMLLRAAEKKLAGRELVGIVNEPHSVTERIETIITPVTVCAKSAIVAICAVASMLVMGLPGFASITELNVAERFPLYDVVVGLEDDYAISLIDAQQIEGMERFFSVEEYGTTIDAEGLYEYAMAIGLKPEQRLSASIQVLERPCIGESCFYGVYHGFSISDLQAGLTSITDGKIERFLFNFAFRVI